ncbi:MAG: hypothetical protein GY838_13350 [bacterium]|nr:hypothetical protein [bacterium]
MAISNPSFETALQQSGVDIESVPADWTDSSAAVGLDTATFGPPYEWAETFEALWDGNEDAITAFVPATHLTAASFGSGLQQTVYDSFEQLWPDNEDAISAFTLGDISAATFGSTSAAFDSFETEWPARHPVADTSRLITESFIGSTPGDVHSRLNEIKATFNAHRADAAVHSAADSTNIVSSPDATDLASSILLVGEMHVDCWAHITDGALAWHRPDFAGALSSPTFTTPSTYSDCGEFANYLMIGMNLHFTWADNAGPGFFTAYDVTFANIYAAPAPAQIAPAGSTESFETNWQSNETSTTAFAGIGTDLAAAGFFTGGAANTYESFETEITLQALAGPGYGTPLDINPGSGVRVTISGTFVATLVLQVRRPGSTTWLDWDTATAPGDIDVDEGYSAVRIRTLVYTSGTPAAKLKWRPIETL